MDQERYSRQILFKHIKEEGQHLIGQKHVMIVGMGALGTHVAEGLIRAGIQQLTIVDRDYIELSNIQRQTLFTEQDAKDMLPKVIAAKNHLEAIRHDIDINAYVSHVDAYFLDIYTTNIDLIVDATDNFETRQLINDIAYQKCIPWIYGGVVQSTYAQTTFIPGKTPCFNCLVPQLPSINLTCDTVGVIQPAVTMTTSFQLADALKVLTNQSTDIKLKYGDIWEGYHHAIGFKNMHNDTCPTCGKTPNYPFLKRNQRQYTTLCGRDTVQYNNSTISQEMLEAFLKTHHIQYKQNPYMIVFTFNGYRIVAFNGGRLLIHGMNNPNEATKLINQLFG